MVDDKAIGVLVGMNTLFLAIAQSLIDRGFVDKDEIRKRVAAYPLEHIGADSTEARDSIIEEIIGHLRDDETPPYRPEWFRGVIEGDLPHG